MFLLVIKVNQGDYGVKRKEVKCLPENVWRIKLVEANNFLLYCAPCHHPALLSMQTHSHCSQKKTPAVAHC
jgi:hypothetical protein